MGRAPERAARLYFRASGAAGKDAHGPGSFQHRQTRSCGRRKRFACAERESRRLSCPGSVTGQSGARSFTCAFGFFSRARGLAIVGVFCSFCVTAAGGINFARSGRITCGCACTERESRRLSCPGNISDQGGVWSFACKSICFSRDRGLGFSKANEFARYIDISCCGRITGRVTGISRKSSARSLCNSRWALASQWRASDLLRRLAPSASLFTAQFLDRLGHAGLSFPL
jgi:hypothetical protein